jgi:hypothetical protein
MAHGQSIQIAISRRFAARRPGTLFLALARETKQLGSMASTPARELTRPTQIRPEDTQIETRVVRRAYPVDKEDVTRPREVYRHGQAWPLSCVHPGEKILSTTWSSLLHAKPRGRACCIYPPSYAYQ